jgi:hypothetical protein
MNTGLDTGNLYMKPVGAGLLAMQALRFIG